jgi:hypothetical protein
VFERTSVNDVQLQGLVINIGPKRGSPFGANKQDRTNGATGRKRLNFDIARMTADGAVLEIEPKVPGKDPLRFYLDKLAMRSVGTGQPMAFKAALRNAKPPGDINTDGRFGPWQEDDPRGTPVWGSYTFQKADLSVFKGISGILSSTGQYTGVLERIDVHGQTDTPDFALKRGGNPVRLQTTFHSIVNGTDGETLLDPVDARFLNSEFICKGGVVKKNGEKDKTVDLEAVAKKARMEDILELVVGDAKPVLTGDVAFKSKIIIPPGKEDVIDKLRLQGDFSLQSAIFTSPKVEHRLTTLSNRARGIDKEEEKDLPKRAVASNLTGAFKLNDGRASFSRLAFGVPGARIKLAGDYNLRSREMDFNGFFQMHATLAETQSGIKHWLLKPLDPFFEKNGAGFQVPLAVSGTREQPTVAVTVFHHTFSLK